MADQLATDIIAKIKAHAEPDGNEITVDTELGDLGIHSLELTEIVFDLEEAYGIEIEMNTVEAWNKLKNVGDIVEATRAPDRGQRLTWRFRASSSPALAAFAGSASTCPRSGNRIVPGRSAIGPITIAPLYELKVRIGCEIKTDARSGFDRRRLVTMDRFSLIAAIAAGEALRQSGIVSNEANTARIGAVIGSGIFGAETVEDNYRGSAREADARRGFLGAARHAERAGRTGQHGARPARPGVRRHLGLRLVQPRYRSAADQLRLGRADIMVAGGSDAPLA